MPFEKRIGLPDLGPFGKALAMPAIVFRRRVKLGQVVGEHLRVAVLGQRREILLLFVVAVVRDRIAPVQPVDAAGIRAGENEHQPFKGMGQRAVGGDRFVGKIVPVQSKPEKILHARGTRPEHGSFGKIHHRKIVDGQRRVGFQKISGQGVIGAPAGAILDDLGLSFGVDELGVVLQQFDDAGDSAPAVARGAEE